LEYLSKTLHTAYTYVHEQCVKISCNLEMVTRMAVAHFKWNDPKFFLVVHYVNFMWYISSEIISMPS